MTKEELKTLSDQTFFDNNTGSITPTAQRTFNNQMIDFAAQQATDTQPGIVKSSATAYKIKVNADGTMEVNGLGDIGTILDSINRKVV